VDDFYAARDNTTLTLPWTSIAPPITPSKVALLKTAARLKLIE